MIEHTTNMPQLPKGWAWARLEDICSHNKEKGLEGAVPYLEIGDIDISTKIYSLSKKTSVKGALISRAGDILVSRVRPTRGAVAITHEKEIHVSSALTVLRPILETSSKYIHFFLAWNDSFLTFLGANSTGTMYPTVKEDFILQYRIPLSPLPEQHRIAAKIEELLTKLDAGVEALNKLRIQLKSYRQAVLKAAFEGKLTAEWRKTHKGELEPSSALLKRIKAKRAENIVKYKELPPMDVSNLLELPEEWVWTRIGEVFDVYVGATPSRSRPEYWSGNIPWVSSGEVAFCRIHNTKESITELGLSKTSTNRHQPGTVLLGMIGEGKTRGQAAILDISACNNQNSAAIRVSECGMPPEYIYYYLEYYYKITRTLGSGNNQPALNKSRVQLMTFPFTTVAEQDRIVQEIERHLSVADQIERTIELGQKQSEILRKSILKKAFEGKLAPQEPNDEPAEKLLERIRAEKASQQSSSNAARSRNKRNLSQGRLV